MARLSAWLAARKHLALLDKQVAAQRYFSYVRVGIEQRTLELLPDHHIGLGADRLEQRWTLRRVEGRPHLCLDGEEATICRLAHGGDGSWHGRWLRHEQNEVILRPAAPPTFGAIAVEGLADGPIFREARSRNPAYQIEQLYRRTVAGHPELKRLYEVASPTAAPVPFGRAPGRLCTDVLFGRLRDPATERIYWSKRYASDWTRQLPLEIGFYETCAGRDDRAVFPVDLTAEHGLIFDFDPALFSGNAVHLYGIAKHLPEQHRAEVAAFAGLRVPHPSLGEMTVAELTDFQTVDTPHGLRFIDFAIRPQHWWML